MEKVINKIEKFGDTLSPDVSTQRQIWSVVNSRLETEKLTGVHTGRKVNMFKKIFMNFTFKYAMAIFIICLGIGIPVYLFSTNVKDMMQANSMMKTSDENTVSEDQSSDSGYLAGFSVGATPSDYSVPELSNNAIGKVKESYESLITQKPIAPATLDVDNMTEEEARAKDIDAKLSYYVKDIWSTVDSVYLVVKELNAYTTSSSTNTDSATFVIKVPVDKFEDMHMRLKSLSSSIDYESIYSVDKQNEVSNFNSEIKTYEEKINDLQSQLDKATDQNEKTRLQNEINMQKEYKKSVEDSLNILIKNTDFSTITLTLKKDNSVAGQDIVQSFKDVWIKAQGLFIIWLNVLLYIVLVFLAISPIAVPLYFIIRNSRNKAAKLAEQSKKSEQ